MGPRKIRPLVVLLKVKSIKRRRLSCCPSSNNKVEAVTTRHTAGEKRHFLGKLFLFMTFLYAFYECISYPVSSCEYIRPFCVLVWADIVLCCFGLLCNVFVLILSLFRVFSHVKLFVHSEALLLKESADIFPFPCLLRLPCQCKIWGRTFCFHSRSRSCICFLFSGLLLRRFIFQKFLSSQGWNVCHKRSKAQVTPLDVVRNHPQRPLACQTKLRNVCLPLRKGVSQFPFCVHKMV